MHVPEYSLKLSRPFAHHSAAFFIVAVGNQIADYALIIHGGADPLAVRRSTIRAHSQGLGRPKLVSVSRTLGSCAFLPLRS
jgi:hypothetical protein